MIYSSKQIPYYNYRCLDEITFIKNIITSFCNTFYIDDYYLLYKKRFYDSNIIKYMLIMYMTDIILNSETTVIYTFYSKLIDITERSTYLKYLLYICSIIKPKIHYRRRYEMAADLLVINLMSL